MRLYSDKWKIEITEISYNPNSADNIIDPDDYIVICDDYTKMLLLSVCDISHSIEKNIVLSVSFFTPNDDYAFILDDNLYLFLNDTICVYNLNSREVVNIKEINLSGTLFSVYRYHDDFILYCEMDIIRMTKNLDVVWDFMGRDIFVRYKGNEPAFKMQNNCIQLYDFLDNYYEIDYDGKIIKDLVFPV